MKTIESSFLAHPDKGPVSSLTLRPAKTRALIVLGHGAGAGMNHATMDSIAQNLAEHQIATFRYQFPFMERGGGRDSLAVSLATVRAAVRQGARNFKKKPIFAAGHSFGGRMTSLAAAEEPLDGVTGLVFYGFPLHAPGKPSADRAAHLPGIDMPMLFLSGTRDNLMTRDLFNPILKGLGKRVTWHDLDTANHGYKILKRTRQSEEDIFAEMARVTSEWIDRLI